MRRMKRLALAELDEGDLDLDPNEIFRPRQAEKYLGYKHSQLDELIKKGEIEPPFPLSDSGRAVAWTGRMLINHHRRRLALRRSRQQQERA
jgi:hypothetical protein